MSYWFEHLAVNDKRFILKRTIRESTLPSNVSSEDMKAYFMVNTILKKNDVYYLCESIDDAEIVSE
jgi:hypothetical protein